MINPNNYINDAEKSERVSFIKKGIEARLEFNLSDPYMIMSHIYGGILDSAIVDLDRFSGLTGAELQWMNNMVSEALKFCHVFNNVDTLMDLCTRLKSSDYGSKAAIVKEFETAINNIQNDFRRSKNEGQTEAIFSLRDG